MFKDELTKGGVECPRMAELKQGTDLIQAVARENCAMPKEN